MSIVTLDQAKARLRVDGDAMDADIELALAGATAAVLRYLKRDEDYPDNEAPADVKNAVILLAGIFIRDPDGAESQQWQQGYLPAPVVSLLYPLRDPSAA